MPSDRAKGSRRGSDAARETPSVSVVICTHNPRVAYFQRCLDALAAQSLPHADWELLIVDNRSDIPISEHADLAWRPDVRIVREETLGLTPARLRGIREAKGELLVFVDDDNVLEPDFLRTALDVAEQRPFLGSWSGDCRPEFEEPPPEWTRRYWGNLAIRRVQHDIWSNLPRLADTLPCGAGLCIRRGVAQHYLRIHEEGRRAFQLDRSGKSLISGGDQDLAACACDTGLGVGVIAALRLTHLIPPERLTLEYQARLAEGIHFSAVVLAAMRGEAAEVAQYRVRWTHVVRAFLARGADRRVQFACLRGRRRGLAHLARRAHA